MVSEHILSQIVNENEREVFKGMRDDMSGAKALLNEEQFAQFMRAATINQTILADASTKTTLEANVDMNDPRIREDDLALLKALIDDKHGD